MQSTPTRALTGAAALLLTSLQFAFTPSPPVPGAPAALTVVGRQPLSGRGQNAALAVAGRCAWVGSRDDAPVQVLDITHPAAPRVAGALPGYPGSTPRELRAVPGRHLLVVLYYRLRGGPSRYDIYNWDADCAAAHVVGHWDFGSSAPHEFYLWQDPGNHDRTLLYTAMFASATEQLRVIDISEPARPRQVGGWAVPAAYGSALVHSVALAPDGRTAYLSLWTGGLVVADVSDFAAGRDRPILRPLTPPGAAFRTPPGNVHSAVALEGGSRVLTTDERYPAPFGAGCPYGPAHVIDISEPARPREEATLAIPENDPATCLSPSTGTWTSHNPTLTAHLAFITWYSAGLQVFRLDDPAHPARIGELRPGGVSPAQRDLQLGVTDSLSWSYPVISGGLIYIVDINQGLLVLRYSGPYDSEVAGTFAEGNSNLRAAPATADPPPSPAPGPATPTSAAPPRPPTASSPRAVEGLRAGRLLAGPAGVAGLAGLAAAAAILVGVALARRRGRRG